MFQNLRQGASLYVFEKGIGKRLKVGQVVGVSAPTPVYATQTAGLTLGMQPKMEMTVRAKVDGSEGDFAHLPIDQSVWDYGTMIVSDNREAMLAEIDALKHNSESVLESVPYHEGIIASCEEAFKELNPSYAKEQERDEAISELSGRLSGIESDFTSIKSDLSQVLELLKKK